MAHFRATIEGNRGMASRCGTKNSGIQATINGWNIGCTVNIHYDHRRNKDVVTVFKSGGSNSSWLRQIAKYSIPPQEEQHRLHD